MSGGTTSTDAIKANITIKPEYNPNEKNMGIGANSITKKPNEVVNAENNKAAPEL